MSISKSVWCLWRITSRTLVLVALASTPVAAGFVTALPMNAETLHLHVNGSGNAPEIVHNNVSGTLAIQTQGSRQSVEGFENATAEAATIGFFSPIVSPTHIAGLGKAEVYTAAQDRGRLFLGAADATSRFEYEVGLSGPMGGSATIDIGILGQAITNPGNGAASAHARIIAWRVNGAVLGDLLFDFNTGAAPFGSNTAGGFFSSTETVLLDVGEVIRLHLEAQSSVRSNGLATVDSADANAFVDPSFTIGMNVPNRDLYRLEYSPNLSLSAAVPEPSGLTLMGLGVLGLLGAVRRRRKTDLTIVPRGGC